MLSQIYSIILENIFAALLFVSFMIYYTNISFSLYSSCFIFITVFIVLVCWLHHLYNIHLTMMMTISFVVSVVSLLLYYVVNNLFTTKYRVILFLFPVSFLFSYNVFKMILHLLPLFI